MFLNQIEFEGYGPFIGGLNSFSYSKPITLIIGRNNSGKSMLVDLLCKVYEAGLDRQSLIWPKELDLVFELDDEIINNSFKKGSYTIFHFNMDDFNFGRQYLGRQFRVNISDKKNFDFVANNDVQEYSKKYSNKWREIANELAHNFKLIRNETDFRRLSAERDIKPEISNAMQLGISVNGVGASNYVQYIINESTKDESLIEEGLLRELNVIMAPDSEFVSIRVQLVKTDKGEKWEIFLQEEGKRRFPLSSSGSGLKTVILVLLNLLMAKNANKTSTIFCFEELENNLHPALQRRLFNYLYDFAVNENSKIILTSHSPVAINTFFGRPEASIYHVERKSGEGAKLRKVNFAEENLDVLEDLGIKASDILQTNGIVWVEGPSDRIYIKAWLEALYGNELKEGLHYQFLYYGGKLLSHYSAEETAEKINIMFTNPHSAIVIDSDRKNENSDLNATKKRIRKEFNQRRMFYWITKGKEIENYLSLSCLKRTLKKAPSKQVGELELFPNYIEPSYKNFSNKKVEFAKKVAENISKEDLDILDLKSKLTRLHDEILKWNK